MQRNAGIIRRSTEQPNIEHIQQEHANYFCTANDPNCKFPADDDMSDSNAGKYSHILIVYVYFNSMVIFDL